MKSVDLFKQYKCMDLQNSQGKVFTRPDKVVKKRVIELNGNVTTAAILNIPTQLYHNYIHIHMMSTHIFMINITGNYQGRNFIVSISNLYKTTKYPSENQIQFPCEPLHNWSTLIIDLKSFFNFQEITHISISGSLSLYGVHNCNQEILPKEGQLHRAGKQVLLKYSKPQKENIQPKKGILKKPKHAPLEEEPIPQEKVSPAKLERPQEEEMIPEVEEEENFTKTPLLMLKHIHGYTPSVQNSNLVYLDDAYFAYPCDKIVVIMNETTQEQKFCATNLAITTIAKFNKQLIVACNSINNKNSELLTFHYQNCSKIQHFKLEGYYQIFSIDSYEEQILVCALDHNNRFSILLIINDVIRIKQVSPFHIHKLRFHSQDKFITAGNENIRYWQIKTDTMTFQGHSPYLGNYARETHFTDLMFHDKRVLACCKKGRVFQFIDQELSGVWQISECPVTTMRMFNNFILTTHKDGIRYWKPDFSEVIRSIKSDVEIIGCDSRKSLICAFQDKSIARVTDSKFQFLIHSHQQDILDIIYVSSSIISSSLDHCICVWNSALTLEYQFRCLDGLANCLVPFNGNFIAGFDNGLLRLFDLQTYHLNLEIDTKHSIISLSTSQQGHLILVSQENETLVLNQKLLIITTHKNRHPIQNGFNSTHYFIAAKEYIKVYAIDSLAEKYHLNIPISSVDFNDQHLLIASRGHLKRFDEQMNFLHELVTKTDYVKCSSSFVFSNNQDLLNIFDYQFRGDAQGIPLKQVYNQKVNKLVFAGDEIISFCGDFIFIWQSRIQQNDKQAPYIPLQSLHQVMDITMEKEHIKKQKIQQQKQDPNQQQSEKKQPEQQQQQQQQRHHNERPTINVPIPHSPKTQKKQLIIEDQIPQLRFKKIHSFHFKGSIQQIPWNRSSRFYVTPANLFLNCNYYSQEQQQLILTEEVISMHQHALGILVICKSIIQIFNQEMEFIKSIQYVGEILCAAVSLCGNYLVAIIEDKIQIYEISSGRLLTQSIIQLHHHTYIEWCSKQELMFVVLTGFSTQLWRLNQRALLEYCDVEAPVTTHRSCASINLNGRDLIFIGQDNQVHVVDVRQARMLCTANVTQQEIQQVCCSNQYLLFLTNSPNVYYYKMEKDIQSMMNSFQNKAQIISLDSRPLGYSSMESDLLIATRTQMWYMDLVERVTVKMQNSIPNEHRANAISQGLIGTSEGTIMIGDDEILVPKRQCTCLDHMGNIIVAGFDDGMIRLFKEFNQIGQIKVGKIVSALKCFKDYFIVGNEIGQMYYCYGNKEIIMNLIQEAEFEIISIDASNDLLGYSTGNQKVQILQLKQNEEFNIIKQQKKEEQAKEYFLIDSYRFRSIERTILKFCIKNKDQIIMACNNIVIRNYVEHLNILVIETQCSGFIQYKDYLVVGRKDGTVSLYDNEIELDKQRISNNPIQLMVDNKIVFSNIICELL